MTDGLPKQSQVDELDRQRRHKGIICKGCRKLRTWDEMTIEYSVQGRAIYRTWFCAFSGDELKDERIL